jgi:hypothetical protein
VTSLNIEARGDTLRVHVYAGANPMTGRIVSVRGTDDAARRKRRILNRPACRNGEGLPAVLGDLPGVTSSTSGCGSPSMRTAPA